MRYKKLILASAIAAGMLIQQPAQAAVIFDFNFINTGGLNKGFSDPTLGAARQTALVQSGTLLGAYFSNYNAIIKLNVNSEDNNSTTLASAASGFYETSHGLNGANDRFKHTIVQQKILLGSDANGAAADGDINWNFGISGGWDLDDSISATAFDFKSTAMHEILHAMGFTSTVQAGGQGVLGGPGNADFWNTSDQFITDKDGNRLINVGGIFDPAKVGVLTAGTLADNETSTGNGTFFDGANAKIGNGNNRVNLFSQADFDAGSSIAHLDDAFFTSDALLMEAATDTGQGTRTLSALEIGYLKDIGYTQINTSPVPVPAAVWFMGTGLMGLLGMRRKNCATAAS